MPCAASVVTASKPFAAAHQIRVQVVSSYQAFLDLEPVWTRVVEEAAVGNPFLEFAWARTWWECFGKNGTLHVLVLWEGNEPIAIAPLMQSSIRIWGLNVRRLGFLYNSHVPRADFIIARRFQDAYHAIWKYVTQCTRWDLLELFQLPESSLTLETIRNLAQQDGHSTGTWPSGASPYVSLHTSWAEYCESLATKHRSNLRNRFKRLNQMGPVEIETISRSADLPDALEEVLQLEAAAWKGDEGTAIASTPDVRAFYSEFAKRAAARGWLRLNFVRVGGKRVACDYSISYRNQIFLLKVGYDPAFSAFAPSTLLLSKALEHAFADGLNRYDFLGEFAEWKRSWAKESISHDWLFVFAHGFKGRLLHSIKFGAIPLFKRLARRS
jgi:CelD/BcsL family acetyltransferase involved in cellulose biosynthesis